MSSSTVVANGCEVEAKLPCSLEEFLLAQELLPRSVVVELNGAAVAPSEFSQRRVERLKSHPLTFKLDQIGPLRELTFLGEPLWKYLASLIYILLAFYASKLIDFLARVWLTKLSARTETKLDDLLLSLLRGPVKV